MYKIIHGDCIDTIKTFSAGEFDAVITDPPYSSGGLHIGAKSRSTKSKYLSIKPDTAKYAAHNFTGDNMDQLSFVQFTAEWARQTRRITKTNGVIAVFIDWRQLSAMITALQMAGWTYRGVAVWDKINARPQKGRFRQQTEFVVWGSNGDLSLDRDAPILPGVIRCAAPAAKVRIHQTQKPIEVMRWIVQFCERGGKILDPFCGSGSTLEAAELEGYDSVGIEVDDYYYQVAIDRLQNIKPGV